MSESRAPPPLLKHKSWSPDSHREEAWLRRKGNSGDRRERSKSVTDDDLDELRSCIELGFGFDPDSPRLDPKLARTFPALELYCAVHRHYGGGSFSRSSSSTTLASTDSDTTSLVDISDEPEMMKTRLRYWARRRRRPPEKTKTVRLLQGGEDEPVCCSSSPVGEEQNGEDDRPFWDEILAADRRNVRRNNYDRLFTFNNQSYGFK